MKARTIRIEDKKGIFRATMEFQGILFDLLDAVRRDEEVFPVELEVFVYRNMIAGGLKK